MWTSRPGSPSRAEHGQLGEHGGIARALLWVLGAIVVAGLVLVAFAPELLRLDAGALAELFGLVLVAGVPGLVLLVIVAVRRRRLGLDDDPAHRTHRPTDERER